MGKSRKKKNADFKKVKLKVGRRLPKGKDVDLSFATKKICIREEKPLTEESSGHRVLYLSRIVPRLHSRHSEELVSGLNDLKLWMKQNSDDARQLLLMEMQTGMVPLMRHIEVKVRDAARQVFTPLLHLVNNTPAYYPSLAQGMFSALVHIDVGVRAAGWEYLRLMIEVAPRVLPSLNCSCLLDELSRRIPHEAVGLSSKRTGNVVKLMERLLTTLSPGARADHADSGPLKVDGMLTPSRSCIFDWDSAGMDKMWLNGHVSRAMECGLGWAGEETYSVTNFLSDLSSWFAGQVAEFQTVSDCREEVAARLLSLLTILKTALRHHVFVEPLAVPSFSSYVDSVEVLWKLFPLPEDVVVFRTANMTILHVKCLVMVAGGEEADDGEARKLGTYFNDTMPAVWPPSRSLCLQWTALAELCLRPHVVQRRRKWTDLLVSVVRKIADCNAQQGSKVGALCRQIVSLHCDMTASCSDVK